MAVVRFAALLRHQGLPLTPLQVTDATRALEHLDLGDRAEVYLGLRAVLVGRPEDVPAFDRCFASFWRAEADTDEDRKSTRLNSSHIQKSRMPSSA